MNKVFYREGSLESERSYSSSGRTNSEMEDMDLDVESTDMSDYNGVTVNNMGVATAVYQTYTRNQYTPNKFADSQNHKSLWIGNITPLIDEPKLDSIFSEYGKIESIRILRRRECAFINFYKTEDARKALKCFPQMPVFNLVVRASYSKSYPTIPGADQSPVKGIMSAAHQATYENTLPSRTLWIGNVYEEITDEELYEIFSRYGRIESFKILRTKLCGFINYSRIENAIDAKEGLNGHLINNISIKISYAKELIATSPEKMMAESENGDDFLATGSGGVLNPFFDDTRQEPSSFSQKEKDLVVNEFMHGKTETGVVDNELFKFPLEYMSLVVCIRCRVRTAKQALVPCLHYFCAKCLSQEQLAFSHQHDGQSICPYCSSLVIQINQIDELAEKFESFYAEQCNLMFLTSDSSLPDSYSHPIKPLGKHCEIDSQWLKDLRKFMDITDDASLIMDKVSKNVGMLPSLCIDHLGNTIVQKMIEKGNEETITIILDHIYTLIATIGVHKNGTWVIQKLLQNLTTPFQIKLVSKGIRPYILGLLNDQFGNYVIQCVIYKSGFDFIYDAIYKNFIRVSTNRFGSRAIKSCLESNKATIFQKRSIMLAIMFHSSVLIHDINGIILVSWFLDHGPRGRYIQIAQKLRNHLFNVAQSKLGISIVLKLLQREDYYTFKLAVLELFEEKNLMLLSKDYSTIMLLEKCLLVAEPHDRQVMSSLLRSMIDSNPTLFKQSNISRMLDLLPSKLKLDNSEDKLSFLDRFIFNQFDNDYNNNSISQYKQFPQDDFVDDFDPFCSKESEYVVDGNICIEGINIESKLGRSSPIVGEL